MYLALFPGPSHNGGVRMSLVYTVSHMHKIFSIFPEIVFFSKFPYCPLSSVIIDCEKDGQMLRFLCFFSKAILYYALAQQSLSHVFLKVSSNQQSKQYTKTGRVCPSTDGLREKLVLPDTSVCDRLQEQLRCYRFIPSSLPSASQRYNT